MFCVGTKSGLCGIKCFQLSSLARLQVTESLWMPLTGTGSGSESSWDLQQLWSESITAVMGQWDVSGKGVISQRPLSILCLSLCPETSVI